MKKIIVVGIDSFHNRGVEALARSIVQGIHEYLDPSDVSIYCRFSEYNSRVDSDSVCTYIEDPYRKVVAKGLRKLGLLFTPLPTIIDQDFKAARQSIQDADLVISTGGDIFGKDYGGFQNYLTPLMEARRSSTQYLLLGHSIGPFRDEGAKALFRDVAMSAALITCRETRSLDYVVGELGLPKERVVLVGDVAFLLHPAPRARAEEILAEAGVSSEEACVAVSISGGISQFSGQDGARHVIRWNNILSRLVKHTGMRVVVIPHVWSDRPDMGNDDMIEAKQALQGLEGLPITLIERPCNATEYKAVIGTCKFLLAERMHAVIAGLSQRIPTVAVSYSVKVEGIIGDLFEDTPESERPILSIAELIENGDSDERILNLFDHRETLRAVLQKNIPIMMERARANFTYLRQLLWKDGIFSAISPYTLD